MTISKTSSQEATGKSRTGSNSLNPDAPEFNPTTKSCGKLNADAPEFVPGQLPHYEPLMLNVSDIKGGYKNGHMSGYRISHQEPYMPMWLSQSYPVPYQQIYPNGPYEYIPYDYTRQTQNYPIQRNVYPNAVHNDYPLNMPYNVVVQGKSKLSNKSTKSRATNKDSSQNKDGSKEKDPSAHAVRDSVSVTTTKETNRDALTSVRDVTPQPQKPLTWAERTKLSTMRQLQKPTIISTVSVTTASAAAKASVEASSKEVLREAKQPTSAVKPPSSGSKEHSELGSRHPGVSAGHSNLGKSSSSTTKLVGSSTETVSKAEEKSEQISYAKVFKEAVKSATISQSSAVSKEGSSESLKQQSDHKTGRKHETAAPEPLSQKPVSPAVTVTKQSNSSTFNKQEAPVIFKPTSEVVEKPSEEVTPEKVVYTSPQSLAHPEVQVQSQTEAQTSHTEITEEVAAVSEKETSEQACTHETPAEPTEAPEEPRDEHSTDYSLDSMLKYYTYLLSNRNMVDEIRVKYSLPHIKFTMNTAITTPVKSSFKERERDRSDRADKKDWRHKGYDKNFGNNFRFNNKDFTRSEQPQPIVASEGSWLLKQMKQKKDKEVQLRKKIMGLLNKLTFEKFDVIYKQIIECGINTPERAEMLVKFVFDKAVTQHHFIPMYVELCSKLAIDLYTIEGSASKQEKMASELSKQMVEGNGLAESTNSTNNKSKEDVEEKSAEVTPVSEPSSPSESKLASDVAKNVESPVLRETSRTVDSTTTVDTVHRTESMTGAESKKSSKEVVEAAKEDEKLASDSSYTSNGGEKVSEPPVNQESMESAQSGDEVKQHGSEEQKVTSEVPDAKSNRRSDFMRILLSCSQDSFEDNLKPLEIPSELEGDDRFEYEQKYKHKMRGNMMFVGELFKQKLLAAKLLITCLDQVFLKREECIVLYDDVNMGNNHLEAMCTLLQTVGRSFDTSRWKLISDFEKRIQHLEDLGKNEQISFRIRCLIKNVLDSRLGHWDKSIYQTQDQPCKLQELRHKHSATSFTVSTKSEKQDQSEDLWRMRNKKKTTLSSTSKSERHKKDQNKSYSKESDPKSKNTRHDGYDQEIRRKHSSDQEEMKITSHCHNSDQEVRGYGSQQNSSDDDMPIKRYDRPQRKNRYVPRKAGREEENMSDQSDSHSGECQSDLNSDDQGETSSEHGKQESEKVTREAKSIVNELILSHDTEESTLRVEELNLPKQQLSQLYRALVVACMETCSKVNAEKQTEVVTKWITELAKEKKNTQNLLEGMHKFVFGNDESSMEVLVEDFPLLPQTLKTLVEKIKPECQEKEQFKQILARL